MSAQDRDDILFGIAQGFDFIAASFVRSAADILEIRRLLDSRKCDFIKIVAKIENHEGVENIAEILNVADGIMVARGDMGVEIDFTEILSLIHILVQSITATGLLRIVPLGGWVEHNIPAHTFLLHNRRGETCLLYTSRCV